MSQQMTHSESPQSFGDALTGAFGPLDDEQLQHRKEDLLRRATLVAEVGWDQLRYQWSTGEVLGTALVLHDRDEMLLWHETADSVLGRWAFDLWGIDGGQTDEDVGCPRTLGWFDSIRTELTSKRTTPATTKEE
jgi:hypothetical protein